LKRGAKSSRDGCCRVSTSIVLLDIGARPIFGSKVNKLSIYSNLLKDQPRFNDLDQVLSEIRRKKNNLRLKDIVEDRIGRPESCSVIALREMFP